MGEGISLALGGLGGGLGFIITVNTVKSELMGACMTGFDEY